MCNFLEKKFKVWGHFPIWTKGKEHFLLKTVNRPNNNLFMIPGGLKTNFKI